MKSGFVSIVGKTNVGKSSIINSLVGEKVAAIANRPQTTRKAIKAIVNRPDSQIIFIDTPGIHKPQSKLSDAMIETSLTSIQDVDLIVFVVEAFAKEISEEEKIILEKIKKAKKKTILVINKMDLASIAQVARAMELYKNEYEFKLPLKDGENKISISAYADSLKSDYENTFTKKVYGTNGPKISALRDGNEIIINITDENNITKVTYNFNGEEKTVDNINKKEYQLKLNLVDGNNYIIVDAYNQNDKSQYKGKTTK